MDQPQVSVDIAPAFQELFRPARLKAYYSGRGAAKSWSFARALGVIAYQKKRLRIACLRELQKSIKDSVHFLLKDQLERIGLISWFEITDKAIRCKLTGSEFIFAGIRHNTTEIKSMEGVDIAWVEEAQMVSRDSWELLMPTIRKPGSEIWVSFNPVEEEDATYQRMVVHPPKGAIIRKVSWRDNPWFTAELEAERKYLEALDPEAYGHVWEGECLLITDAVIFRGKYLVEEFETPVDPAPRFFYGADFGFATDPACLIRCYITKEKEPWKMPDGRTLPPGDHLWVDYVTYGYGVETDDLPTLYTKVPDSWKWPIKGDSSRPETISYIKRHTPKLINYAGIQKPEDIHYNISAADKWQGSVEDGIAHLRAFVLIHVHPRCKEFAQECRLYRYKVDERTKQVLPIIIDKHNHGWDALRYALDGYIKRRGVAGVWGRL